jgi:multidrug resistance efflux pump
MRHRQQISTLVIGLASLAAAMTGCQKSVDETATFQKPPKPVSTMTLRRSTPSFTRFTPATVAPWKAERIGFELTGRVVEVIEPNEMVTANMPTTGNGTVLARLDDERLKIALKSIEADIEVARRRLETNRIGIQQRIPASIKTAEAELKLAENELRRSRKLSSAISRSELDTAQTQASTARLQVTSAKSQLAQAKAEQLTLEAQVRQAQQRMAEAQRNLRNSVLYSSFPGQVAEVHVAPGAFAEAGTPIVSVLMMDPMLVEFEVTAEDSRRYRRGDSLSLNATDQNGKPILLTGMVYTVDSVADPETRTFTVSLHARNKKVSSNDTIGETPIARTQSISPLNTGSMVTGDDRLLVDQNSIHKINGREFVWKITNRMVGQSVSDSDRSLRVERLAVKTVGDPIPFLGKWNFIEIKFDDPSEVDLAKDLITGELHFVSGISLDDWQGDRVILDNSQWMLRAGDVVNVSLLPDDSAEGFYVPMKAIRKENDQTFVHAIDPSKSETQVRRIPVNVANRDSAAGESIQLMIESVSDEKLTAGIQVVVGGTHFLKQGDRVRVVPAAEEGR